VQNMLQAGYLEDWIWGATLSGAPQGGVVSPILSNEGYSGHPVEVQTNYR